MTSATPSSANNETSMAEKFDEEVVLISTTFLVIIIIMALFGNVLVVTAFAVFQKLRNVTNYFIVSLAVADILVAAVSMPVWMAYLITGPTWMFDKWVQQVNKISRIVGPGGRCGGLMVSALDSGSSGPRSSPGQGTGNLCS